MKTYDSFNEMMKDLGGLTFDKAQKMGLDLDDHGDYASLFACYPNQKQCDEIMKNHKLNVITLSIYDSNETDENEDCDESSPATYSYSTGFHMVNREMWLFYKGRKRDAICDEKD